LLIKLFNKKQSFVINIKRLSFFQTMESSGMKEKEGVPPPNPTGGQSGGGWY
jgi:hypothetical protein